MTHRTYNQYCPIAHTLDLVGERWTLLILRNLFVAPGRFSDLLHGLPGLGTNMLTDRLKKLEDSGLIQNRYLPPPAASSVYELTAYGRSLEPVLSALTAWGEQTLAAPQPGQIITTSSAIWLVRRLFEPGAPLAFDGSYAVRIRDRFFNGDFGVIVREQSVTVEAQAPAVFALEIGLNLETLRALGAGQMPIRQALAERRLQIKGAETERASFLARFP